MKLIKNIGLIILSLVLLNILLPIGLIFALLPKKQWYNITTVYFWKIAYSIDQLGNVILGDLFNLLMIKDDSTSFGNPDESLSSVIGKNKVINNLTKIGKALDWTLEKLDKGHSINAIEEDE